MSRSATCVSCMCHCSLVAMSTAGCPSGVEPVTISSSYSAGPRSDQGPRAVNPGPQGFQQQARHPQVRRLGEVNRLQDHAEGQPLGPGDVLAESEVPVLHGRPRPFPGHGDEASGEPPGQSGLVEREVPAVLVEGCGDRDLRGSLGRRPCPHDPAGVARVHRGCSLLRWARLHVRISSS